MRTDFEELGLAAGPLRPHGRKLIVTVDFEAFIPHAKPEWIDAMRRWAERSSAAGIPAVFFVAVENVVQLRHQQPGLYERFLDAARELAAAGTTFHPHNHYVFDAETGERPAAPPEPETSYGKRRSMFFDAVHRHGLDLSDWLAGLVEAYERFLTEARIERPPGLALRAGGWDYGSGADDLRAYNDALERAGFAFDSSASAGEFDTPSWRVGSPFGDGTFRLASGVTEVAPSWSMPLGERLFSRPRLGAFAQLARRHPRLARPGATGVFVPVLHFDHLFHARNRAGSHSWFSVTDARTIQAGIDSGFSQLHLLAQALRLEPTDFGGLALQRV